MLTAECSTVINPGWVLEMDFGVSLEADFLFVCKVDFRFVSGVEKNLGTNVCTDRGIHMHLGLVIWRDKGVGGGAVVDIVGIANISSNCCLHIFTWPSEFLSPTRSRREQENKDYMTFRIRFFKPVWEFTKALHFTPLPWIKKVSKFLLTLFRMGIFGTAHGWGEGKRSLVPLSKSCNSYPTMMKLGPVIP